MTSVTLVGSTGQVGSQILATLVGLPTIQQIHAFTRRELPIQAPKLTPIILPDIASWPASFPTGPPLFLSALGTTRAAAGGADNQRKIDHDANLELARAARAAGVDTYVLISSTGANAGSMFAYPKMKGELEDAVKGLGFKHVVIVQPGLIVCDRQEARAAEYVLRVLAKGLGSVSNALKDPWAQDATVIGRAAVRAGLDCIEGKREEGVWVVGQSEIIRLGRTEWKET